MQYKAPLIGIIGAMEIETEGLRAQMTDTSEETVSGIRFTKGLLEGFPVVCATCGVGKVAAALCAEAMILHFGVTALLNTGVAGGLAKGLTVGDVVLADFVVQHDMDTSALGDPVGLISGLNIIKIPADKALLDNLTAAAKATGLNTLVGTVASGDLFVARDADKARIAAQFDAAACEMEGAAIGQVAYTNGVPFAVLRAISDGGDGMEFSQFVGLAAKRSVALTREFVKRLGD
ncbi:MAG: 5'-methylthioadenosine/adenosylhomocysteine nucleosidase [Clostridia bacterium]|nr:5'-methylthioadenosine/adenosylhomocysteine nucleosidase [Clostridia bacterium]